MLTTAIVLCALQAPAVPAHGSYPETIPLPNDWQPEGIATDGDTFYAGSRRIAVQSRTGKLFLIHPRSGDTEEIDLGGGSVPNGDGLLLDGRTLYVVQNRLNQIAVIRLDRGLDDGRIVRLLTDDDFDVPTRSPRDAATCGR